MLLLYTILCVCFIYAAYKDCCSQHVSNKLWLFMLPFGVLSLIMYMPTYIEYLGILLVWIVAYMFWKYHLYGGADAKSVCVLALFLPHIYVMPLALWILLGACVLQLIHSIIKKEFRMAKPFMIALAVNVVIVCLFINLFML